MATHTNSQLSAARAAATAARAQHEDDLAALARGRERLAATAAECERLVAARKAAAAHYARSLEKQTRAGASGPPPALVDAQALESDRAQRTHEATRLMVTNLESAARDSAAALARAEGALQSAAVTALGEEADEAARALEALRAQMEESERLLGAVREVPGFRPSPAVYRALRDDLHVPISELTPAGSWDKSWHTPLNRRNATPMDEQQFWRDRLQSLLSGAADDPPPTATIAA